MSKDDRGPSRRIVGRMADVLRPGGGGGLPVRWGDGRAGRAGAADCGARLVGCDVLSAFAEDGFTVPRSSRDGSSPSLSGRAVGGPMCCSSRGPAFRLPRDRQRAAPRRDAVNRDFRHRVPLRNRPARPHRIGDADQRPQRVRAAGLSHLGHRVAAQTLDPGGSRARRFPSGGSGAMGAPRTQGPWKSSEAPATAQALVPAARIRMGPRGLTGGAI